ncbi:unnamed protein product [Urochloa humidicola]
MEERTDLLSQLPRDVLISILEKAGLRDAIRAGVLSRRWRDLPSQLPILVLDIDDFRPPDNDEDNDTEHDAQAGDGALAKATNAMEKAVTALLASRTTDDPPCTVAMTMPLRYNYMSIGRLLDDAVADGKVRTAELTVCSMADSDGAFPGIELLVRYRRRLLRLCRGCPAAFGALTRLVLSKVGVQRLRHLGEILRVCTELETMSMDACGVLAGKPQGIWMLRHGRLADFRIINCGGFEGVVLDWLPRLERFAYKDSVINTQQPLSFGHVPRLKTLSISKTLRSSCSVLRLSEVLANTAVSDLRLNFRGANIWVKPEAEKRFNTRIFNNLKHLRIRNVHQECGLSWTMFLLQVAPNIKELYIKLWDHECDMQHFENGSYVPIEKKNVPWEVPVNFKHYNLTRLTILGFYNTGDGIVTYLRSLVQSAVNLEEIHIRENAACKKCGATPGIGPSFPRTDKDKDTLRDRISGDHQPTSFKICLHYTRLYCSGPNKCKID